MLSLRRIVGPSTYCWPSAASPSSASSCLLVSVRLKHGDTAPALTPAPPASLTSDRRREYQPCPAGKTPTPESASSSLREESIYFM